MDRGKAETDSEARRLRELFRGRFDQDTAVKLVNDMGGLLPAIDFVLREKEEVVATFLKQSPSYLQSLREESQKVASLLENKIEDSVRQFVCGACKRSWWQRVPLRKEVSKCRRCHVKYDPLPREHESGIGNFKCSCGNEFTGFATMGETNSECYECGELVPVDCIVPQRKNKDRKRRSKSHHSCNGVNCYNNVLTDVSQTGPKAYQNLQAYPGADLDRYVTSSISIEQPAAGFASYRYKKSSGAGITAGHEPWKQDHEPVCVHPKSHKRLMRHVSQKHTSTGSTVSTFLSQNSIDNQSISVWSSFSTIQE